MPRPTVAQLVYGSATVVLSTLAMLLLSRTESGPGIGVIAVSAIILGLFVALSVPKRTAATETAEQRVPQQRRVASAAPRTEPARGSVREPAGP